MWLPLALIAVSPREADVRYAALGIAGLLVSSIVGAILGPIAVCSSGMPYRVASLFALTAVLVGSVVWGALFTVLTSGNVGDTLGFAVVGLIVLGIPLLILAFNLALLWAVLVRRLAPKLSAAFQ